MKTHKKTPGVATLARLFKSLKADICDDYRCSDDTLSIRYDRLRKQVLHTIP